MQKIENLKGTAVWAGEATTMREAMEKAYASGVALVSADLRGAYLKGAYLSGAYLRGAAPSNAGTACAPTSRALISGVPS